MTHFAKKNIYCNTHFPSPHSLILRYNSFSKLQKNTMKNTVTFFYNVFLVAICIESKRLILDPHRCSFGSLNDTFLNKLLNASKMRPVMSGTGCTESIHKRNCNTCCQICSDVTCLMGWRIHLWHQLKGELENIYALFYFYPYPY
jgi:hypothetical protein